MRTQRHHQKTARRAKRGLARKLHKIEEMVA